MAINPYINLYGGEVTEGGTDGTPISCDGAFTYPLSMLFDISKPTIVGKKCLIGKFAVRTAPGFCWENLTITFNDPIDPLADKYTAWSLSWYNDFFTGPLRRNYIYDGYGYNEVNINKIFYVMLSYTGSKYDEKLDKKIDLFTRFQDTGISINAKIAPVGYTPY
jgi:hypothetical protein